jgi:peptidoglycan/xylan/chitin deacetylase (PgdA/CDA1 family)
MISKLAPAWFILLYHDVSWEEGPLLWHIGGTCPPDIFRDHVKAAQDLGRIVSVRDAYERFTSGRIDEPLISFWFDDGLRGVSRYAVEILDKIGVTGATSICSRFAARSEMFWRFKLSYLHSIGATRELRSRLQPFGLSSTDFTRDFSLTSFSADILGAIDKLYVERTSAATREDDFKIFDTPDDIVQMHRLGWEIANHSAAHYSCPNSHFVPDAIRQFEEAEEAIKAWTGTAPRFWVLPFGMEADGFLSQAILQRSPSRTPVAVGQKANRSNAAQPTTLYRICPRATDRRSLARELLAASGRLEAFARVSRG